MKACRFMIVLVALILAACTGSREPDESRPKRVLRIALPSTVRSLDPYDEATQISGSIFNRVFDSLICYTFDMQLEPGLAVQWSNPDEKTWLFELRHDVTFHDGSPFTAEDVKFSFETLKASPSVLASALTVLDHVEVVNRYAVRMIMNEPASNFLPKLFGLSIVSRKSYKPGGNEILPGTGPYKVSRWSPGRYVQLESVANYWGGRPKVDDVRFEAIENPVAGIEKLLKGEVDVIPYLEPDLVVPYHLEQQKEASVQYSPGLLVLYLGFDTKGASLPGNPGGPNPFRDVRVRQAVYRSIQTGRIIRDIQKGYADEATQLVSPLVYGYDRSIQRLAYDPGMARKLLAEAGYPKGFDVRLDIPNNRYRAGVDVGNAIVKDLAAVGIRVNLNAQTKEEWMQIRMENRTPFYLAGWTVTSGDASGALDYIVHTPDAASGYGRTNSGGYSNPEIDQTIEAAARAIMPEARLQLMKRAMDLAMKDCGFVPLYIERNLSAYRPDLQWTPRADGIVDPASFSWK